MGTSDQVRRNQTERANLLREMKRAERRRDLGTVRLLERRRERNRQEIDRLKSIPEKGPAALLAEVLEDYWLTLIARDDTKKAAGEQRARQKDDRSKSVPERGPAALLKDSRLPPIPGHDTKKAAGEQPVWQTDHLSDWLTKRPSELLEQHRPIADREETGHEQPGGRSGS
jgi:hypothetical protein